MRPDPSEYYAYQLYNLITEYSFRVRLFEVTLLDTGDKLKSLTRYAFIIESADRLNATVLESENILDLSTDAATLGKVYLFQYLIGNTDRSIPGAHNIQMITKKDAGVTIPIVIPYDFDLCWNR